MTDKEFYTKCIEAGKHARKWKNKFVSMLPEIARRGLHKKHGFATIVEFAAKVGGVGKSTVEAIFRVEKYVYDKPVLKKLVEEVGVSKVRVIATIATKENQHELAKRVKTMSKAALELFAREEKQGRINCEQELKSRPGTERRTVNFGLDEDVEFKLRKFKQDMGGEKVEWNDVIKALLEKASGGITEKVVRKSERTEDLTKIEKSEVKSKQSKHSKLQQPSLVTNPSKPTRYIAVAIQQNFSEKCEYPGCNMPAQVTHHPERFALSPNHNNLKRLCKAHHELVHNGFEPKTWNPKTHPIIEQKFIMSRLR